MRLYDRLGVVADWEPETRIVHVGPTKDPVYDAENARLLLDAMARLIDEGGPIVVLGRGRGADGISFGYALKWMDFLRKHQGRVRLIVYELPESLRTLARVVEWTAKSAISFAKDEREARALAAGSDDAAPSAR